MRYFEAQKGCWAFVDLVDFGRFSVFLGYLGPQMSSVDDKKWLDTECKHVRLIKRAKPNKIARIMILDAIPMSHNGPDQGLFWPKNTVFGLSLDELC